MGSNHGNDAESVVDDYNNIDVLLERGRLHDLLSNWNNDGVHEFDTDDDDDGEDLFDMIQSDYPAGQLPQPLYPMGPLKYKECIVCLEMKDLNLRTCCATPVCDDCVLMYVTVQIEQGNVKIGCPNDNCDKYVHRDEVSGCLGDINITVIKL